MHKLCLASQLHKARELHLVGGKLMEVASVKRSKRLCKIVKKNT